jgi:hypothetical protein
MSRHGIEYRGRTAYIVVAPSTVQGRIYQVNRVDETRRGLCFDWPAAKAMLDPPKKERPRPVNRNPEASLAVLADFVGDLPEGNRNSGLFWAANRAVEDGLDPWDLTGPARAAGLHPDEIQRTIRSAIDGNHL